jgi:NAD+ diphosphatase
MKFCSECGKKLILKESVNCGVSDGLIPYCENCKEFRFPTFNVAVSNIIYNKDYTKVLLIQQYGRKSNILVAGYVNKGENLIEAVKREIKEEVGLDIISCKFNDSRYYEKSNSLICNFIVTVENENFYCNPEVDFAKWYNIDEACEVILQGGIAQYFLQESIKKVFKEKELI